MSFPVIYYGVFFSIRVPAHFPCLSEARNYRSACRCWEACSFEVTLLVARMCADWDRQQLSGRKAWGSVSLIPLHAACGGFLAFLRALRDKVPPAEYQKHFQGLNEQFMVVALDPEIHHALQTTVPPANLEAVNFLRQLEQRNVTAQKHLSSTLNRQTLIYFCIQSLIFFIFQASLPIIVFDCATGPLPRRLIRSMLPSSRRETGSWPCVWLTLLWSRSSPNWKLT